jgi:hypothetical protein
MEIHDAGSSKLEEDTPPGTEASKKMKVSFSFSQFTNPTNGRHGMEVAFIIHHVRQHLGRDLICTAVMLGAYKVRVLLE